MNLVYQIILGAIEKAIYLDQSAWSKMAALNLAVSCGNQHNQSWSWKKNLNCEEFLHCLMCVAQLGRECTL